MTPACSSDPTVLRFADDFTVPLDAVTETFAILAKRRAGKSNAAVVMAEEMYGAGLPWVAVDPKGDWWGVRAHGDDGSAPGLSVVVFGGLHGDVPLDPSAGKLVADLIVQKRLTCVLDVSEMSKAEQRRFLADWAEHLYRKNRLPLHVFAEEADEYIPQRVTAGDARLVGAWESLIKRGGFRGIGVTLVSQRSSSLNKDVLSQVETLIAMRTPSPHDRRAILGWVEQHDSGRDVVAELPALGDGQAWVFSPQWLRTLVKITFRRRRTFDSGATPKVDGGQPRRPARLADVDLHAIRHAMSEMIERAAAEDPIELRRQVRHLQDQLAAAAAPDPPPATPVERIEVPVVSEAEVAAIAATVDHLSQLCAGQIEQMSQAHRTLADALELLASVRDQLSSINQPEVTKSISRTEAPRQATAPARTSTEFTSSPEGHGELRKGARRMVEALGRMAPLRLTKSQWGTVARLKTSGGTWSTYLSDIRRAGLIDENAAGFTLSEAGFNFLGGRPEPMTAQELQQHYRGSLRAGAAKMFDALLEAFPGGLTRDALGAAAGLATSGGTFSTYLSDLTRNGLAERAGDEFVASTIVVRGAIAS